MQLRVTVTKCNYDTPTKGGYWCLIRTDAGTAKGVMAWVPQPDERLCLEGKWIAYRGEKQFEFSRALPDVPDNPRARLHYCVELADGCGPAIEDAIWIARGEDFAHIEDGEVNRLKGEKYKAFIEATEQLSQSEDYINAVSYLLDLGCSWNMAEAAWKAWGKDVIGVVKNNVYRLSELPNYGFSDADKLRGKFGIGDEDPRRIRAAIGYCIGQRAHEGSTAVDWQTLREDFRALLPSIVPNEQVAEMMREGELIGWTETKVLTTAEAYQNEKAIWDYAKSKE